MSGIRVQITVEHPHGTIEVVEDSLRVGIDEDDAIRNLVAVTARARLRVERAIKAKE